MNHVNGTPRRGASRPHSRKLLKKIKDMNNEYPLLPIPGWEDLYATQGDQVISLRSGKPLKPGLTGPASRPYYSVVLCRIGCKPKIMYVHRAVLSANLRRTIAEDMIVNHKDNNQLNNNPNNLRELSNKDNTQSVYDRKRAAGNTGTNHRGVTKHTPGYLVQVGINGVQLYVGKYLDYNTACKIADDAFAGILPPKAQARLEKLKLKKNQSK